MNNVTESSDSKIEQAHNSSQDAQHIDKLLSTCSSYMCDEDVKLITKAYEFAKVLHNNQRRRSGELYINHPVEVAIILAELKLDVDTIVAALLHDVVEDTEATFDEVEDLFNSEVVVLVDGVTKLTNIEVDSLSEEQAQNLRKMFLAMSKDIRVIIIKLADRLHNMRTLMALPEDRRIFKARETMDIYAPLANRLGITSIKWELEDLAFFYLDPAKYQQVNRMVSESREAREQYLEDAITRLEKELSKTTVINFSISGRPKHLWSIHKKMQNKGKDFSEIYDLIALRVLVNTVGECYSVLGAVHTLWHPMPGRFKDYIAMPKSNFYQSLHTTVIGPAGRPLEIQIRTHDMHQHAEYGVAAHWLYKESGKSTKNKEENQNFDEQLSWLKRTMEWQGSDNLDPNEYMSALKIDLFDDEVYVFTPQGDVMSLRAGSTPIDFAYAIHTEVGHRCVGAKVNGMVVPLTSELKNGDRVEILTQKNSSPSRDWLQVVKNPSTRSKIRSYFSKIDKSDDEARGRDTLSKSLRKYGYGISTARTVRALKEVAKSMGYSDEEDLFAGIGSNKVSSQNVTNRVSAILEKSNDPSVEAEKRALLSLSTPMVAPRENRVPQNKKRDLSSKSVVINENPEDNMGITLSQCCNPVMGDEIIGFVTRGRGVTVHRADCPNVAELKKTPERLIDVSWNTNVASLFQVEIVVEAIDRVKLLGEVTALIGDAEANILSSSTTINKEGVVQMRFLLEMSETSDLDRLISKVKQVKNVLDARRVHVQ